MKSIIKYTVCTGLKLKTTQDIPSNYSNSSLTASTSRLVFDCVLKLVQSISLEICDVLVVVSNMEGLLVQMW